MITRNALLAAAAALALFFSLPADAVVTMGITSQKPNMGELVESAMQGLDADPVVKYTSSSAGLTPIDGRTADLDDDDQDVRHMQNIVIENFSSSVSVCICSVSWATACSAATCSCRGGANPKSVVAPGKSKAVKLPGTRKPCTVTSAALGEYQVEISDVEVGAR